VSFVAITLCVASQRVFIVVRVYFVIDSDRKLLDTHSYILKYLPRPKLCRVPCPSSESSNNNQFTAVCPFKHEISSSNTVLWFWYSVEFVLAKQSSTGTGQHRIFSVFSDQNHSLAARKVRFFGWQQRQLGLPVCIPMRSFNWSEGLCRIVKPRTADSRASDILAISRACRFPFRTGKPDTTM
jgi:hypothetical protein